MFISISDYALRTDFVPAVRPCQKLNNKAVQFALYKGKLALLTDFKTVVHFLRNIQGYFPVVIGLKNRRE